MSPFRFALSSILVFAFGAMLAAHAGRGTASQSKVSVPARSFEFT